MHEPSTVETAATVASSVSPPCLEEPTRTFDGYSLIRMLGEGGMGEVWLAEQDEPLRRRVALKIVKAGMDTKEVVARFESERQALAMMDHPAIAKVFDAGWTPEGRPYFVMEYVEGVSITEHCDGNRLSTAERVALFTEVCEGVQHAHQKAVIHRDLKPSNILVATVDGRVQPKVIDFGIAKAIGRRLTDKTLFTELGAVIGTPEYMSPEQADSTGADVDTRSDVYSLGVVLYQLLTGALPFSSEELRSSSWGELRRILYEREPARPSTHVGSLAADAAGDIATGRRTDPGTLVRQLTGDLDAITLKALEKERERRYPSVSDLAEDIRRYLRHEPVRARRPTRAYRAWKYVRRHRLAVSVATGILALLLAFAVLTALQARRVADERDRANREATSSRRAARFLSEMMLTGDPDEARGGKITAREILDHGAEMARQDLRDDPALQGRMLATVGYLYDHLGIFDRAEPALRQSFEVRRRALGPDHVDTLWSQQELAIALKELGRWDDARAIFEDSLARRRAVLGPEHRLTLQTINNLAVVYFEQGRLLAAEALHRECLQIRRRQTGPEDVDVSTSENNLAQVLMRQGRTAEAESLLEHALAVKRSRLGALDRRTFNSLENLAIVRRQQHRHAESEAIARELLAGRERVFGREHPETINATLNLALALVPQGRFDEALQLLRPSLQAAEQRLGANQPGTVRTRAALGGTHLRMGQLQLGEAMLGEALRMQEQKRETYNLQAAEIRVDVALASFLRGQATAALALLRQAVQQGLLPDAWDFMDGDPAWLPFRDRPDVRALRSQALAMRR